MFEEFEDILNEYDRVGINISNEWNDYALALAIEKMKKFNPNDWKKLVDSLSQRSSIWKQRLVNCMPYDGFAMQILIALSYTQDRELFFSVVTKLLNCDIDKITNIDYIVNKINEIMPTAGEFEKIIYGKFLSKQPPSHVKA